jgi:4'-phosphopantetheinyl transferase
MTFMPSFLDIWFYQYDPGSSDNAANWEILDSQERSRVEHFTREEDRRRFTAQHAAMRRLLANYLEIEPAAICFSYGATGKPLLAELQSGELEFNLSHSGELAAIAVTNSGPVGVDLEWLREVQHRRTLSEKVYSPTELAEFESGISSREFLELWTTKEAVLKFTGEGIASDLTQRTVGRACRTPRQLSGAANCWVTSIAGPEGYVGAIASATPLIASVKWLL